MNNNNNIIILSRFYDAYYLIIENEASTNYQSTKWFPTPLKIIPNKPSHFNFDCYGMFFSWIFRDKLEHIKKEQHNPNYLSSVEFDPKKLKLSKEYLDFDYDFCNYCCHG
jgi:hypothetical protein